MSDFDDDDPTAQDANDPAATDAAVDDAADEAAPAAAKSGRRRQQPADDDDWDDDWDDDDDDGRRGGRRDLTVVYAVAAAAIVIVLAVVLTRPKDNDTDSSNSPNGQEQVAPVKNWQKGVGDAAGEAQARVAKDGPAVYIWTDFCGWHFRSTRTSEVVVKVEGEPIGLKDDPGCVEDEKAPTESELTLTLPPGDGKTGKDVTVGGESLTITVTEDGQPVPVSDIKLGGGTSVADTNPLTITKG